MNEHLDPTDNKFTPEENDIDRALRPLNFDDFAGQESILENLKIFVQAAKERGEALDHTLFHGPPGLGKTTLAHILANELEVGIKLTSGPVLDKPGDLAGLLTNLQSRDILFIDEIHRLSPVVEEYLYSAMEDYKIDILIESGPNARTVQINLEPFTLVGATTRSGLLTAPMRARFGISNRLEYYSTELLSTIVERSAQILNVPVDSNAAIEIAGRSRGTPRISNGLLRRIRDFAQIKGKAATCLYNVSCPEDNCNQSVDFTEIIAKDVLIFGLAEDEMKREVLGWPGLDRSTVKETVSFIEAKEMARDALNRHQIVLFRPIARRTNSAKRTPSVRHANHAKSAWSNSYGVNVKRK